MTDDSTKVRGGRDRDVIHSALSGASIAYHTLIGVGPVILPYVDPEGINRVALRGIMERRVANQLQRRCRAVSKGRLCKLTAV